MFELILALAVCVKHKYGYLDKRIYAETLASIKQWVSSSSLHTHLHAHVS